MRILNIAVCDDEQRFREQFAERISQYLAARKIPCSLNVYPSGEALTETDAKPDVVFLDISMGEQNGIDTAGILRDGNPDVCIILVTGYMDYVLEGYKTGALRYLLKSQFDASFDECMEAVLKQFRLHTDVLTFPFTDGVKRMGPDEICVVESRGHKVFFWESVSGTQAGVMAEKLDAVERLLAPYDFLRVHKSYLVNMKYVTQINSYRLHMQQGMEISVPKTRYPFVKTAYALYRGDN